VFRARLHSQLTLWLGLACLAVFLIILVRLSNLWIRVNSVSGRETLSTHYSDLRRIRFYEGYLDAEAFPQPFFGSWGALWPFGKANGCSVVPVRKLIIVGCGNEISPFLRATKQLASKSKATSWRGRTINWSLPPGAQRPSHCPMLRALFCQYNLLNPRANYLQIAIGN